MHTHLVDDNSYGPPQGGGGGGKLLISVIVAAMGSFLFGFDTAVISGTTEALRDVFGLNDNTLGFTVSSALIGTLFGALLAGRATGGGGALYWRSWRCSSWSRRSAVRWPGTGTRCWPFAGWAGSP